MTDGREISKADLLEPDNMIRMYAHGAFPMADDEGIIEWYYPQIRAIIPLKNFNIPRSLKQFMSSADFGYKYDQNILRVIKRCASRKRTWISGELIHAYSGLIERGNVHSVEVYKGNKLVGGLYGVTFRGAFFGESMFSAVSQASKCALVKLVERLNKNGFELLDIQFTTPHLEMFGAVEIEFEEYQKKLLKAYSKDVSF